ncbi:MAG: glycosyltransferase family 2 protein [Actinomycetia bacterium]|nr:glycosyltransferase family 2 protein [Actinomycetes bacterium]MCP4957876.1 glycosyltransferase family 2 protein [Actinomycetes bacterium]
MTERAQICVVLPAYNEAENLPAVLSELSEVLAERFERWEVLVIDDGSTDATPQILQELSAAMPQLRFHRQRRNFGKSEGLRTAFELVDADLVALMDADGQDDPREFDKLLAALDDGYDLVTGRRSIRNDRFIKRNTSKLYNWTTSKVSGVEGRDFNSGFKLMRIEVARAVDMYGEMHRYIPPLAEWAGYRSTEVDVNHRERIAGQSKFGKARFWRGFFDLITVKFLTTYETRPFHLIGALGLFSGLAGASLLVWMFIEKLLGNAIGTRPALTIGVLLIVVSVQLISVGLLAELFVNLQRRQRNRS